MDIVFLLYEGMTALDFVGPHEVLSRLPDVNVCRAAFQTGQIRTDSNLLLIADYAIADISRADVLLVPGSGNASTLRKYPVILEWIYSIHKTTTWTTSVCTGSLILGAAGLLSGVKATTHWAAHDRLKTWGAIPVRERVVEDGKIMTAAGVSAGIDMALTLASKLAGSELAQAFQLGIEYDPRPPFDAGSPEKAPEEITELLKMKLRASFENEAND